MIKFICYPKCTTCQKAKKWLDDHKIEYEMRDIKLNNPSFEELTEWYKKSGFPLKKFFNTSGLLYKSLDLKNKLSEMTEDDTKRLGEAIINVKSNLYRCPICHNISDDLEGCEICKDHSRDKSILMVVETIKDVFIMEKMQEYKGIYRVK